MSGMPWIKLSTDILDDVKLARMNDATVVMFVKLIALAGICDAEGYLVDGSTKYTMEDIAWRFHRDEVEVAQAMQELAAANMVTFDEQHGAFLVIHFSERQGRPQEEKRAAWRERQDKVRSVTRDSKESHAGVTPLEESRVEKSREEEEEEERERESDTPTPKYPDDFPFDTLMPAQYDRVDELKTFRRVTKRMPGTLQLTEIVLTIRRNKLRERDLVEPWRQWAILNGYRQDSLVWLTEWAVKAKAGEKPWERKVKQPQAETGELKGRALLAKLRQEGEHAAA